MERDWIFFSHTYTTPYAGGITFVAQHEVPVSPGILHKSKILQLSFNRYWKHTMMVIIYKTSFSSWLWFRRYWWSLHTLFAAKSMFCFEIMHPWPSWDLLVKMRLPVTGEPIRVKCYFYFRADYTKMVPRYHYLTLNIVGLGLFLCYIRWEFVFHLK